MALGVYGATDETSDIQFALTVYTARSKRWVIWPFISKSLIPERRSLQSDLVAGLDQLADYRIAHVSTEFPN